MRNLFLFLLVSILLMCKNEDGKYKELTIIVSFAQSYKVDFGRQIYTVYYFRKKPTEIRFRLSEQEKIRIAELYYELKINELSSTDKELGVIEDNCLVMPKLYTTVEIKTKSETKSFKIDKGCNEHPSLKVKEAERAMKFLDALDKILKSKTEIKRAPKTDIWYL